MSDELYEKVFERNREWAARHLAETHDFFEQLAQGQHPEFLFIGCSDSRVPASEVMGFRPGHVFVHRNIANVVPNTDTNAHAVIQYAVEELEVDHVVICGHYGCGGVAAAMASKDLGLINGWLHEVRDVYRLHCDELDAIEDEHARYRRLVELNVREQCINVAKTSWVQKRWNRGGTPSIHGWVYDLQSGHLVDMKLPYKEIMNDIAKFYRIDGDTPDP